MALTCVHSLMEKHGVDPRRIGRCGYGRAAREAGTGWSWRKGAGTRWPRRGDQVCGGAGRGAQGHVSSSVRKQRGGEKHRDPTPGYVGGPDDAEGAPSVYRWKATGRGAQRARARAGPHSNQRGLASWAEVHMCRREVGPAITGSDTGQLRGCSCGARLVCRLEVGSESGPDRSKSVKSYLMQLIGAAGNHDLEVSRLVTAESPQD